VLRCHRAENERQQREIVEQQLQERQLNFEAVFLRMRSVGLDHGAALQERRLQCLIDLDVAERSRKRGGGWHRHAAQVNAMTGPDQYDATNRLPQ
jgi:hypothetical protein